MDDAGGDPDRLWLDCLESPLGPAPRAVDRVRAHADELHRYPRRLTATVTELAAREFGVGPDQVLLTNGVDEAAELVALEADTVWSVSPGFYAYADRARVLGRETRVIPLDDRWEPAPTPHELTGAEVVYLAQPHSPTGNYFSGRWVCAVVDAARLVFVDRTYEAFADDRALQSRPSLTAAVDASLVVVFHSFSKSYGLAGLRLGALVGSTALIDRLRARQRPEAVNSVALHALAGALDDPGHQQALRAHVLAARPRWAAALSGCPLFEEVRDTQANFVLARCRDGAAAAEVVAGLAERNVLVADCAGLGLPGWVRFGIGRDADLPRLLAVLDHVAQAHHPALTTAERTI